MQCIEIHAEKFWECNMLPKDFTYAHDLNKVRLSYANKTLKQIAAQEGSCKDAYLSMTY